MKLKKGFLLRSVAGRTVVIPDGETLNLNLMVALNDTGRFLWEKLENGASVEELKAALVAEYEVSEQDAEVHVEAFVDNLKKHGFVESVEDI
ncbi:MAG: PqqD family protein [Lachnospiraceae bacterium]|nr:PqqD family protein [Lachnospiraceae bacterium]